MGLTKCFYLRHSLIFTNSFIAGYRVQYLKILNGTRYSITNFKQCGCISFPTPCVELFLSFRITWIFVDNGYKRFCLKEGEPDFVDGTQENKGHEQRSCVSLYSCVLSTNRCFLTVNHYQLAALSTPINYVLPYFGYDRFRLIGKAYIKKNLFFSCAQRFHIN